MLSGCVNPPISLPALFPGKYSPSSYTVGEAAGAGHRPGHQLGTSVGAHLVTDEGAGVILPDESGPIAATSTSPSSRSSPAVSGLPENRFPAPAAEQNRCASAPLQTTVRAFVPLCDPGHDEHLVVI